MSGFARREAVHRRAIGDVERVEREAVGPCKPSSRACFSRDVVIGVEIVDADHALAARQQRPGDVVADEPRNTRHQDCHATLLPRNPDPGICHGPGEILLREPAAVD